jgi:hypothetical protein
VKHAAWLAAAAMAVLKEDASPRLAKAAHAAPHAAAAAASAPSPLVRVMREFDDLTKSFEAGLLRSLNTLDNTNLDSARLDDIHREACRLAVSDLSTRYTRKYISRSLHAAESEGKRVEELLHNLSLNNHVPAPASLDRDDDDDDDDQEDDLGSMHNGYFRLYSPELFNLLGQPTDMRFGSLRFHKHLSRPESGFLAPQDPQSPWVHVELALNDSFFVADSIETLPYHTFRLPTTPSLQNRGILSRRAEDNGTFPDYDSWLLFTFLGNGCIKLEVPIEMCADVYGDRLRGRENEEVVFWGFFVDDE